MRGNDNAEARHRILFWLVYAREPLRREICASDFITLFIRGNRPILFRKRKVAEFASMVSYFARSARVVSVNQRRYSAVAKFSAPASGCEPPRNFSITS